MNDRPEDPGDADAMDWVPLSADDLFGALPAVSTPPVALPPGALLIEDWAWHDAQLVGVERAEAAGTISAYEIGCVEVFQHLETAELGGSYLKIAAFTDVDVAAAFYHQLQDQVTGQTLPADEVAAFATEYAFRMGSPGPWAPIGQAELTAYEALRDLNAPGERDVPPEALLEALTEQVERLSGLAPERTQPAFDALRQIGIQADGFDPDRDPPPFFDRETGTAYWVGVFQPDRDDPTHCVASILSVGRNADGATEAQLAPCVVGDWDTAYGAAAHLLGVMERGGLAHCFDAAEAMALGGGQRGLWETERGILLETDAAQALADYTESNWEVDL